LIRKITIVSKQTRLKWNPETIFFKFFVLLTGEKKKNNWNKYEKPKFRSKTYLPSM